MNNFNRLKTLARIRRISRLLDAAFTIPGTKFRIGLDPILGLLPGGGDLISAGISAYVVFLAARFGLPRESIVKMAGNIALETVVGSFPIVGDIFDATFKANLRNLDILEQHLNLTEPELETAAEILEPIATEEIVYK